MRIALCTLGAVLIASTISFGMHAQTTAGTTTLADLRNQARPLLIFASKPDDPQLEIQLRILQEHAPAAQQRDLVPVAIVYNNPSPTRTNLSASEAEAARRQFGVAPGDFTVILIGKDGGEKLRSSKPIAMEKLVSLIDAMPMRQEEMRRPPQ